MQNGGSTIHMGRQSRADGTGETKPRTRKRASGSSKSKPTSSRSRVQNVANADGNDTVREADLRNLSVQVTFKCPDLDLSIDSFGDGLIDRISEAGAEFGLVLDRLNIFLERGK